MKAKLASAKRQKEAPKQESGLLTLSVEEVNKLSMDIIISRAIADTLIQIEDYSGMKSETIAALMTEISDKLTGMKTLLERKDDERH